MPISFRRANIPIRSVFATSAIAATSMITAIIGLFLVKVLMIDNLRYTARWLPLIKNTDVVAVMPWIVIAAALIALVAGTIGMRRFLDV